MKFAATVIPAIGLIGSAVLATMSPANLQDTGNSLARQAFDIKDLVLAINSTMNAGPMQDVFEEIDDMYEAVLANIQLIIGTKTLTQESQDVQLVYEAYSYLAQGMFELMDALGSSATNFIAMDDQNEFRVPASIREVGGVVDAWMFNMIGLFPANSSYSDEAANQKNQVDSHFRRAIASYHLATAKTDSPYGNITNIVSTDALTMDNSTDSGDVTSDASKNDAGSSDNAGASDNAGSSNTVDASSTTGTSDAKDSTSNVGAASNDVRTTSASSDETFSTTGASNNGDASIDGTSSTDASTSSTSTDGASSSDASSNNTSASGSSNVNGSSNTDVNGNPADTPCAEEGPAAPASN
ncbi:Dentin sialophosphoprotein [Lasiodiplodia hormozganensis]|uniref:Dentin sialophosphoprotein n=1 Tax=Lasiodiplodia hormozganensis TaxID=869390 RepID=A0AA40CHK9_9PEZI|nr:Dentin sialophosphoprotein [Lasiodiplodia hormozganensis]